MMLSLLRAELTLLRRDSTAFTTAVALPLVIGGLWALNDPPIGEGVGALAVIQLMLMLAFTLHTVGVMILATRRESGVLRRWRVSGASDTAILGGMLGVPTGLAAIQALGLTAGTVWLWDALPGRVDLVLLGTASGVLVLLGWTVLAAAFTRSAEHAMITTFPVILLLIVSTTFALTRPLTSLDLAVLALPAGPATQLLRMGWETQAATASGILAALGASLIHALIAVAAARATFRWLPRSAEGGRRRMRADRDAQDRVPQRA
jgi:ABC-2 type transport system permease protein